ncbi:ligase-associated DNA damage response endonuclease PdeM [uncultured Cohaesibacter sp.]|uniref:ligase-associated DNA damage response endonuclease PdeM n=1 Tax=uncultured Cohaesibacter sp. TaxID=1002546 RepID=UPI0029C7FB8A|nr:ligase-associated DNA damage response endonuclease PdeM [uncultured Cohaesibacter sp.]
MSWHERLKQKAMDAEGAAGSDIQTGDASMAEPEGKLQMAFEHCGESFIASLSGALFWPAQDALLVADLHLEKGSAFARSGQFLPPYDSQKTLAQLHRDIARFKPARVICLGDSFHDVDAMSRMSPQVAYALQRLVDQQEWIWLTGNHDPVVADHPGGVVRDGMALLGQANLVTLCHEPGEAASIEGAQAAALDPSTAGRLEICGHLHPVARIPARGRILRRKCFLLTDERIIMPAYGSYTGGLELCDEAFSPLMTADARMLVIGRQTLAMHEAGLSAPRGRNKQGKGGPRD